MWVAYRAKTDTHRCENTPSKVKNFGDALQAKFGHLNFRTTALGDSTVLDDGVF